MQPSPAARRPFRIAPLALAGASLFLLAGCKSAGRHTSDSQLRQIDEILNQQLPVGTPMSRVSFFLSTRGYPLEDSQQPHTLVAVVEHVNTETLQPAAARVTFHFDNNDKLLTYELTAVAPSVIH